MHIPDNYLSPSTCAVMGAVMIPVWTKAVKEVKKEITKKKMPLLGVGAAFSFLIMMFNVPLPGGTTGHAVGATLIAILLGPWSACISVTIALVLQAFMFGDGGILAIGANCFNMAFVIPIVGYYLFNMIKRNIKGKNGEYIAAFIAAYFALNVGALCAAVEFGIQPLIFKDAAGMPMYSPYSLGISIPAMLIPHLLVVGLIEGVVTAGVYAFVKKLSPDVIREDIKVKLKPIYTFIVVLIALSPIGLLASGTAWGEWGADEINAVTSGGKALGYVPKGMKDGFEFNALMPDYAVNGMPEVLGYILSALAGVAILIIIFKLLAIGKNDKNNETSTEA